MKLDFEKFLNSKGLKVGDKIHFIDDDEKIIYTIAKENDRITLNGFCDVPINTLWHIDFEKIEPKKVGDLICDDIRCQDCPLRCISCKDSPADTLRERLAATLIEYPELEPMRAYFEQELDKEVEE